MLNRWRWHSRSHPNWNTKSIHSFGGKNSNFRYSFNYSYSYNYEYKNSSTCTAHRAMVETIRANSDGNDYSKWTPAQLTCRIRELEAELLKYNHHSDHHDHHEKIQSHDVSNRNERIVPTTATPGKTPASAAVVARTDFVTSTNEWTAKPGEKETEDGKENKKKKKKRPPKEFDPTRYATRRIALKFAYLGKNYNGFEHHSNNPTPRPTIEEELWKALVKTRLISPSASLSRSASPIPALFTTAPGRDTKNDRRGSDEKKEEENERRKGPGTEKSRKNRNDIVDVNWDGCGYSKCGRTDRGVSAFGQVIGITVRSNRLRSRRQRQSREEGENTPADAVNDTVHAISERARDVLVVSDDKMKSITELDGQMKDGKNSEKDVDGEEEMENEQEDPIPVKDELPYLKLLNRSLPPDIRIARLVSNTSARLLRSVLVPRAPLQILFHAASVLSRTWPNWRLPHPLQLPPPRRTS